MPRSIWLCLALLLLPCAAGSEVAYLCGDDGDHPLDYGEVLAYNRSEVLAFTVAGPGNGGGEALDEIEIADIAKRVEPNDDLVDSCANDLVLKFPGAYTIEQIVSIHGYVTDRWKYKYDPTGYERPRYANESIRGAPEESSGFGDCDDFAIVMASLIENIGGTSRIILARGGELRGGHAYPEVYIGRIDSAEYWRIRGWLRERYGDVYIHTNETTKDAWLNLDWGDGLSPNRPGGPFFEADENIPLYISPNTTPKPLQPINEPPNALFRPRPDEPDEGEVVVFDASNSSDPDENIRDYLWDFGDGKTGTGLIAEHSYTAGGNYEVNLTVVDSKGLSSSARETIVANWLPKARLNLSPEEPEVGELITFDGSASWDPEESPLVYSWNLSGVIVIGIEEASRIYHERGNYTATLTVTDELGALGRISRTFKVNEPPRAEIEYRAAGAGAPKTGENITFNGSESCDVDGRIMDWIWEFDDGKVDYGETVYHSFSSGGEHAVKLTVEDENGSIDEAYEAITINWRPTASFTFDPPDPSVRQTITFDASGSWDDEMETLNYRWDFGDGLSGGARRRIAYDYRASGEYNVTLTVTDRLGASNSTVLPIRVSLANSPPVARSLSPDRAPAEAGTTIRWTGEAIDPEGDSILYMFLLDDREARAWGEDETWSWQTAPNEAGSHKVEVRIRDSRHAGPGGWDDRIISYTSLSEPNQGPALTGLQPDRPSPQEAGTYITWTATAEDREGDPIDYRFLVDGSPMTGWSGEPTWTWRTTDADVGEHYVDVEISRRGINTAEVAGGTIFSIFSRAQEEVAPAGNSNYWGGYSTIGFMGESDFYAYTSGYLQEISGGSAIPGGRKILANRVTGRSVTSSSPLVLDEGYVLSIMGFDPDGEKAYFELSKNGRAVAERVISSKAEATVAEKTFAYKQGDMVIIAVHIYDAYGTSYQYEATVDAIWQISDGQEGQYSASNATISNPTINGTAIYAFLMPTAVETAFPVTAPVAENASLYKGAFRKTTIYSGMGI